MGPLHRGPHLNWSVTDIGGNVYKSISFHVLHRSQFNIQVTSPLTIHAWRNKKSNKYRLYPLSGGPSFYCDLSPMINVAYTPNGDLRDSQCILWTTCHTFLFDIMYTQSSLIVLTTVVYIAYK